MSRDPIKCEIYSNGYSYHQVRNIFKNLMERLARELDLIASDDSKKDPSYVLVDRSDKLYARVIWRSRNRLGHNGEREFYYEIFTSYRIRFAYNSDSLPAFRNRFLSTIKRHIRPPATTTMIVRPSPTFFCEDVSIVEIDPSTPICYVDMADICDTPRDLMCTDWD